MPVAYLHPTPTFYLAKKEISYYAPSFQVVVSNILAAWVAKIGHTDLSCFSGQTWILLFENVSHMPTWNYDPPKKINVPT
jgi:hypothetical protein